MNTLTDFLLKAGIICLTAKRIEGWIADEKIGALEYALTQGNYQIREQAIKGLVTLKSASSLPLISILLDDKVRPVSFAAMNAIKSLGLSPELEQKIEDKKEYWKKVELRQKESARTFLTKELPKSYERERSSKKTLENAKEMLRKPMMGGKWF